MTVKLTFEFENIQQATDFMHGVSVRCVSVASPQAGTERAAPQPGLNHLEGETVSTLADGSLSVAAPKRRGRKPKAKVETAAPAEAPSPQALTDSAPVAAPFEDEATLDEAIAALKAVSEAKGMPVCFDILKRHRAVRTSDVLPRSRYRFIQDCQDVIAGKDIAAAS